MRGRKNKKKIPKISRAGSRMSTIWVIQLVRSGSFPLVAIATVILALAGCGHSGSENLVDQGGGSGGGSSGGYAGSGGGGSGSGGGSSSGSDAGGNDGGGGDSGTEGFTVSGTVSDIATGNSLPGVSVCLLAAPSTCTITDSSGAFSLTGLVPSGSGFTASLAGYVTGVWPLTPTGNVTYNAFLRSVSLVGTWASQAGATFNGSAGAVLFETFDGSGNPRSGVSVSTAAGGTVGYLTGNGSVLDTTLTATTTNGAGCVFEVPSGNVEVTFTAPGAVCTRYGAEGWLAAVSGATTLVPVVANELTVARAVCQ